jgi:DNA-nicking Smr family endonuclease
MGQTWSELSTSLWHYLTSSSPTQPGQTNRQAAHEFAKLAKTASTQSQTAYKAGDHPGARRYADLSRKQWKEHHRLNALAEQEIFTHFNPAYPSELAQIDLHGLFVKEGIARVEKHVQLCKKAGRRSTVVITGWGSHSKDGLAKIKPAIQELCVKEGLRVFVDRPNVGCLTVEVGVPPENVGWDKCIVM